MLKKAVSLFVAREASLVSRCRLRGRTLARYASRFTSDSLCAGWSVVRFEARGGLVEHCGGGAGEGFVIGMVEGIDAELDQAGGQQVEELLQGVG